jgi:hypothetical protein
VQGALYLYGSQYPDGKALNPAAFVHPPIDATALATAIFREISFAASVPLSGIWRFAVVFRFTRDLVFSPCGSV